MDHGVYLMENEKVYQMDFPKVYHLLVSKAEKKGGQGNGMRRTGRTLIEDNAENYRNIMVQGVCALVY